MIFIYPVCSGLIGKTLDNVPQYSRFRLLFLLLPNSPIATDSKFCCHSNMNEISTQHLRAHVYELAGKIGEHNVFHPDVLHAAEAYITEVWQQQGYAVCKQTYTSQSIECANIEITCSGGCD